MPTGHAIVSRAEQPTQCRPQPEHTEDVARVELPVDPLRIAAADHGLGRVRRAHHQQIRVVAGQLEVATVGRVVERVVVVDALLAVDEAGGRKSQPFGLGDRQRPQQHGVDQAERGDGRAEGEAERQDRGAAHDRPRHELPPAEHHIGRQGVQPEQAAAVAQGVHGLGDRHAAGVAIAGKLGVRAQLGFDVGVVAPQAQGAEQPVDPGAQRTHADLRSQALPRSSASMMPAMRSQASRSRASSRRPAAVRA